MGIEQLGMFTASSMILRNIVSKGCHGLKPYPVRTRERRPRKGTLLYEESMVLVTEPQFRK